MKTKVSKKILPILLAAVMAVAMLPPITAQAASNPANYIFDVSEGSITVGAGTNSGTLKVSYGASQTLDNIPATQEITITGTTTSNTVTVSSGVTANITLSGVGIDMWGVSDNACAFNMTDATVSLTLADGTSNTLKSGNNHAGLQVPAGAALAIGGSGTLTASGGRWGAGIGGGYNDSGGTITITGGTVTITGGSVKATSTYGESIGHGQYGTDSGTLTNGIGQNVYLTTVILSGVTIETAVSALTTSLVYTYGIKDMQTDASGKLYLYLPENTKTTAAQTSAGTYTGDISTTADHNATDTLNMSPAFYTISFNSNGGSGTMVNGMATQGMAFTLPPNGFIAPDGKQFKEWAIGDAATGARVAAGDSYTFTAPTTVYAIWEDAIPPTVTGVTPGGTGVPISGNIMITFSEAMDTTMAGAVYLSSNGGITYGSALTGGSWSGGDTVYTIPYSGLSYSAAYTETRVLLNIHGV